jgi:hypothetical protein
MDPEDLDDGSEGSAEENEDNEGSISSNEFDVDGKTDMLNLPDLRDPDEDNPASFFYVNRFLPKAEKENIDSEGRQAVEQLLEVIVELENEFHDCDIMQEKTLLSFTHKLNAHMDLKYPLMAELRKRMIMLFLDIHAAKEKTSVIGRTLALRILTILLGKQWGPIKLKIDWRPYWFEMTSRMYGEEYSEKFMTSETILSSYYRSLALFIYSARRFYDTFEAAAMYQNSVVDLAMKKLNHVETPDFMEGALLLAQCLPNSFDHYAELVPKWFDLWGRIYQNTLWDMAWIQIMSHAVKMTGTTFNWQPYLPFLYSKLKGQLRLPLVKSSLTFNTFPRIVPSFYQFPFSFYSDFHHMMLFKMTKIITKIVLRDAQCVVAGESFKSCITLPTVVEETIFKRQLRIPGFNFVDGLFISESAAHLLSFVHTLRAFVHSSSSGEHSARVAVFFTVILKTFGTYLGQSLGDLLTIDEQSAFPSSAKLFLPSINFVSGYLLTFVLDTIFVEDPRVNHAFARCIEHLVPIIPDCVHIFGSLFLDCLEPRAFQNSGHGMIALKSLGFLIRPGLFPQPLILPYLSPLLRLSLLGLEASDPDRINAILYLLYQLFSWLPVSSKLRVKVPNFHSYPQLLCCQSSTDLAALASVSGPQFSSSYQAEYDSLVGYILQEWFPQLLERVFVITEAEEAPVKGAESTAITIAGQLLTIFYQALEMSDEVFVQDMADKLLNFVLQRAPAHTNKTCGKLIEYFVSCFPRFLNFFLDGLLSTELMECNLTADRIVFRLRLVAATFRRSAGHSMTEENATKFHVAFVQNYKNYLLHKDAKVRKMIGKVFKDVLKSLVSVYPINQSTRYTSFVGTGDKEGQSDVYLGIPNVALRTDDLLWFVPNKDTMQFAIQFLRDISEQLMQELMLSLELPTSSNKVEECVGASLAAFRRISRGVASLLSYNIANSNIEYQNKVFVNTGRESYIALLPQQQDRDYIIGYQGHILRFLVSVHQKLESKTNFGNNVFIRKQWMKCLHVLVTQRLSVCTDCETYRADLVSTAAMATSALSAAAYKRMKFSGKSAPTNFQNSATLFDLLRSEHYWKRHDWNVHSLSEQVWTQHGIRALFFALQESHFAMTDALSVTRNALDLLLSLTHHNYDEIHPQARAYFLALYDHFPLALRRYFCEQLLEVLYQPHPGFYSTASTLVLLTSRFIELIHTDDELKSKFLLMIPHVHSASSDETDEEKKEVILATFSTLFIGYANGWSFPLNVMGKARVQDALLGSCLESFGAKMNENEDEAVTGDLVEAKNVGWKSRGLRFDTFQGFILAHLFEPQLLLRGHLSTVVVRFMWYHLTQCDDQPTQYIGDVLLFMIVNVLQDSDEVTREQLLAQPWTQFLRSQLHPLHKQNCWKKFLTSQIRLALHAYVPDGSNIWSDDVDAVVDTLIGPFLCLVSNRQSRRRTGMPQFSLNFSDSFATMIYFLCEVGIIPVIGGDQQTPPSQIIRVVLFDILQSEDLSQGHHPQENRLLNDLRAEIFGGFLKFFFVHHKKFGSDTLVLDKLFAEYLTLQVSSVNLEYLQDWQEALYFATESLHCNDQQEFAQKSQVSRHVLKVFASTVMMAGSNLRSQLFLMQQQNDEDSVRSGAGNVVFPGSDAADSSENISLLMRKYSDMDVAKIQDTNAYRDEDAALNSDSTPPADESGETESSADDGSETLMYEHAFPLALSRQASLSVQSNALPASAAAPPVPLTRQTSLDSATALLSVPAAHVEQTLPTAPAGLKRQRSRDHAQSVTQPTLPGLEPEENDQWEDLPDSPNNQRHHLQRQLSHDSKFMSSMAAGSQQDGGFVFIDKAFGLMRAWLLGLGTSALYLSQGAENEDCNELWALADEVIGFLSDPQIDLVMAYTSSRAQLMIIVVTMLDVSNPKRQQELRIRFDAVLEKILRAASADSAMDIENNELAMDVDEDIADGESSQLMDVSDGQQIDRTSSSQLLKNSHSKLTSNNVNMQPVQDEAVTNKKRGSKYHNENTEEKWEDIDEAEEGKEYEEEHHPHKKMKKSSHKKADNKILLPPRPKKKHHTSKLANYEASQEEKRQKRKQNAVETLSFILTWLWHMCNTGDVVRSIALKCLPVLLEAVAADKNETVQEAVASLFTYALGILQCDSAIRPNEACEETLRVLTPYLTKQPLWHENWRVREVLLRIGMVLCSWHWHLLDSKQKQIIKDIFVNGLKDPHRQVQDTALLAMPDYLALKTDQELKTIADAYLRNSETLLAREKQKRRQKKQEQLSSATQNATDVTQSHLDAGHITTVQMLAALVLARPYDLPAFIPLVISSLLRHSSTGNDIVKSIIQRTVQEFRASHQDHWEQDLRHKFTAEQLEDLQGAGAAHYFA